VKKVRTDPRARRAGVRWRRAGPFPAVTDL